MRLDFYINETKLISSTMIGFLANSSDFKKVSDYIQNLLYRFKIRYDKIDAPHFSIALLPHKEEKDDIIRQMDLIQGDVSFKPINIEILEGIKKDFIVILYKANSAFIKAFKELDDKYEVKWFGGLKPHISLFSVNKGSINKSFFDDIEFSPPKLPKVKSDHIGLWDKKFKLVYKTDL